MHLRGRLKNYQSPKYLDYSKKKAGEWIKKAAQIEARFVKAQQEGIVRLENQIAATKEKQAQLQALRSDLYFEIRHQWAALARKAEGTRKEAAHQRKVRALQRKLGLPPSAE